MMNQELKTKAKKISFLISVFYVGIGTLSVLSMDPDFILAGDWAWFGYLLTFPVSIIGFGIIYTEVEYVKLLIVTQSIVFLIFWLVVYRVLLKRYIRKNRKKNPNL
jgi:hypothetical protein